MKRPKAPKPTAQQLAVERRQSMALDKESEEQEERQRALARGQLGTRSLLGGVPRTARERATGGRAAAAPVRTMLGAGGGAGRVAPRSPMPRGGRGGPYTGTMPQLR